MSNMLQYGIWSNCCNACDFCLRQERIPYSKKRQLKSIERIKENINYIDWKGQFSDGISLLGGEIYYITDIELQNAFLSLIDDIIEKVLKISPNPNCKYSTVTNGIYNPDFLFKVIDKIVNAVGIDHVDVNFSYDLKYRFHSEESRLQVLKNINEFHKRYDYKVGVQMILTQYIINLWKENKFDISNFIEENIPGNQLCFLYPHPIHTGIKLDDFNFNRKDFLQFILYLKNKYNLVYYSFLQSTKNSAIYKYTGLHDRSRNDSKEMPVLDGGKEIINKCGHSTLYRCYSDTDKCMLCDLYNLDRGVYL